MCVCVGGGGGGGVRGEGKENVRESEQEGWGGDGIGERLDMGVCRVPLCYVITLHLIIGYNELDTLL